MRLFVIYFIAYIKNNYSDLIWILLFAIGFYLLFELCGCWCGKEKHKYAFKGRVYSMLLSLNCSFVFVLTLFDRTKGSYGIVLEPFQSYVDALKNSNTELFLQIVMNIVMYIPLGYLLPCCFEVFQRYRYVLFVVFFSSLTIEGVQKILSVGCFEIDDILNNIIGAILGVMLHIFYIKYKKRRRLRRMASVVI